VKRKLPQVIAPTLLIHATEDDVSTLRSADFVADNIGSDDVHKIVLHNSYHMITLDNERELVADETIAFLTRLAAKTSGATPVVSSAPHLSVDHSA
jgi:carboxylesterase